VKSPHIPETAGFDLLGDELILGNLQWLRHNSDLAQIEGASNQFGALKYQFIADRIEKVSGQKWSTSKVRELFGSRENQRGAPAYRWMHILILAESLAVSLLDILLPHRDFPPAHRKLVEEYAADAFEISEVILAAENRGRLGIQRRYHLLLRQAIWYHPRVQETMEWLQDAEARGIIEPQSFDATAEALGKASSVIGRQIQQSSAKSEMLEQLASQRPTLEKAMRYEKGGHVAFADPLSLDEQQALQILAEFGVLAVEGGA
jgi:hypothetical protein